jgi:hypothetical protein
MPIGCVITICWVIHMVVWIQGDMKSQSELENYYD